MPKKKASPSGGPRAGRSNDRRSPAENQAPPSASAVPPAPRPPIIIGVGASAGGLEAFTQLLKHLPAHPGAAFVLVQHLDPQHESILPSLLARASAMPVHEARDGIRLEPDHVHVIPSSMDIALADGHLQLVPRPATRGLHMPIDLFLSTLAQVQGNRAIAVILSGTGTDGTLGCKAVKAAGGISIAQDPTTAKYDGMPKSAISAGCADAALSPEEIASEIVRLAREPYLSEDPGDGPPPQDREPGGALQRIFVRLKTATGSDFTSYKKTTLTRRMQRRMALHRIESLADYARHLESDAAEVQELHQDLLVSVTSFFRDPETFEALVTSALPRILADRSSEATVRVWVPGCATGEEAYSIAICLLEVLSRLPSSPRLQVFATDLSGPALEKARAGTYLESIAAAVSPERLSRFFSKQDGSYQVTKEVRELVVFARHDLARDPPFSKLDLVSCRNVLIYLEPPLQRRVLGNFHYALSPTGLLLLGQSETVGAAADLFTVADNEHRIFTKRGVAFIPAFSTPGRSDAQMAERGAVDGAASTGPPRAADIDRADRILLDRHAPASVLVDENDRVIRFRGETDTYLGHAQGAASLDLLQMARTGIGQELSQLLKKAKARGELQRGTALLLGERGKDRRVDIEVVPVGGAGTEHRSFLVVFASSAATPPSQSPVTRDEAPRRGRGAQLERELQALRQQQRSMEEEHAATTEELQSANEEALSSNEELQSINEEMETAKEELQSTNEELLTSNEELQNRNLELQRLNDDLDNFISSAAFPVVMLTRDLTVRRFSPEAARILNLVPADVGRPLGRLPEGFSAKELERLAADVMETMIAEQQEIQDQDGRWWRLHVRPYRTRDNRIDGAVVGLVDIDTLKKAQAVVEEARDFADAIVGTVPVPLLVLDAQLKLKQANRSFYNAFELTPRQAEGASLWELSDRQWDEPALRKVLEDVLARDIAFDSHVMTIESRSRGRRTLMLSGHRLRQIAGKDEMLLLAIEDRTAEVQSEEERMKVLRAEEAARAAEEANRLKDEFVATASHELRQPLNALSGWVHVLSSGSLDEATTARGWAAVKRAVHAQTRLTEDLLDMTRIMTGKIQLSMKQVEMLPIVGAAMETARPAATAKGVELELVQAAAEIVIGDPDRLQQIAWNLLSNAVKFTAAGGRVEVSLLRAGRAIQLKVRDTGEGIAPDFLPHVFERFRQGESGSTKRYQGLGLGLAIARQLVELHGGTIGAESPGHGRGATFTVRLPIPALRVAALPSAPGVGEAPAEGQAAGLPPAAAPLLLHGLHILVVEDDDDNRSLVATVLEQSGATVTTVASVAEALRAFERAPSDVVVSDIGLPDQDGYSLIQEIRRRPRERGGAVPAVALTAFARKADQDQVMAAGFQRHVVKPADPRDLVLVIASLSGRLPPSQAPS